MKVFSALSIIWTILVVLKVAGDLSWGWPAVLFFPIWLPIIVLAASIGIGIWLLLIVIALATFATVIMKLCGEDC